MSGIGLWFEGLIDPLLGLLRLEGTGPFLALVIVLLAVLIGLAATWKFYRFYKELSGALKVLQVVEGQPSFWKHYGKIETYFKERPKGREPGLSSCWREFIETLIFPKKGEGQQTVRNMARPREFFDAEEAGFTTPVLRIWPNVFVGIGLVLTFAGLIAALATAVKGMEGRPEEVQVALIGLLTITSAKFYTSLMALGSSIMLLMMFRVFESRRDMLFVRLTDKLELGLEFLSLEKITLEQLECVKSQTSVLEQFNTDLAMKLGDHIQAAVSNAMSPVVKELTAMSKNMGQNNIEAMKEIGEAVAQNVQGAAGNSLSLLSDRLDQIATVLGDMPGNLKESTGEFESEISAAFDSIKSGMEALASDWQKNAAETSEVMSQKLKNIAEGLGEAGSSVAKEFSETGKVMKEALEGSISELAGSMTTFGRNLNAAEKTIGKLNSTLTKASDAIGKASSDIGGSAKFLQDGAEGINNVLQPLLRATDNIQAAAKEINEGISKSAAEFNSVLKSLEEKMQANGEMWKAHSKQFDGVNEKLGKIFTDVNQQIENSQKRMGEFVVKIDGAFKGALAGLQDAVEGLKEAVEEITEERKAGK